MTALYHSEISTPISPDSGAKVWLELQWREQTLLSINFTTQQNPLATDRLPTKWLKIFERYWDRPLERATQLALIELSLNPAGTHYQQRVWSALQQIPLGQTASYGEIAQRLNSSPRAVAAACRANPVVLAVPCHRVVAKSGIGGFMGAIEGDSIDIKRWLLNHER